MDRQQIGLKLALDALGQELDLSDFDARLVLQKTISLAQAAGVDLGYTFNWYLKGPYSPALTRDAFALRAELAQHVEDWKEWSLDASSRDRLTRLGEMIRAIPANSRARRLELLASVQFLFRTRQATTTDIAGLQAVLLRNGKDFSEEDIRQAIESLTTHGLLPASRPR